MSTNTRSRVDRHSGRYVDRHSTEILADTSIETPQKIHDPVIFPVGSDAGFMPLVKYPHCTPITPSRRTKLWKDAATVRAIGVPNIDGIKLS